MSGYLVLGFLLTFGALLTWALFSIASAAGL